MTSNNPPTGKHGSVAFTIKRASGEIEIRSDHEERLWNEQVKHPEYKFGETLRYSSTLLGIKGTKTEGAQ